MDGGPPVSKQTIESARQELPREYGVKTVDERGSRTVIVRVPRSEPDYNFELQDASLYVSLHDLKDAKDVLLVGDEKAVRMAPVRLRDHVREQIREDEEIARRARAGMPRDGTAWAVVPSEILAHHQFLVFRFNVDRLASATPEHFKRAKDALGKELVPRLKDVHGVFFVTDNDYGRVGRRVFVDEVAPEVAAEVAPGDEETANPVHHQYAVAGGTLKPEG